MHQHLVDDQLEEDRRHQGEHLQEQRGDDHFGERLAIAQQRRQEPAEAERIGIDPGAAEPARHQQRLAAGDLREFVERHFARGAQNRIDDSRPLFGCGDREDGERPALHADDDRQRQFGETIGVDLAQDARLQPDQIGAAHQVFDIGEFVAGKRQLMAQLLRVGGDAVIGGDERQTGEAGVDKLRRWRRNRRRPQFGMDSGLPHLHSSPWRRVRRARPSSASPTRATNPKFPEPSASLIGLTVYENSQLPFETKKYG